jgi:hypothetical protein
MKRMKDRRKITVVVEHIHIIPDRRSATTVGI